jgi:hypothetical protein
MTIAELAVERHAAPYHPDAVDAAVGRDGAAILESMFPASLMAKVNEEVDEHLARHPEDGGLPTESDPYAVYLGLKTRRVNAMIAKIASAPRLVSREPVVEWARRVMRPCATSILLNTSELIEIQPGEQAQPLHRDSWCWAHAGSVPGTIVVNAMIALTPFTEENGATSLALGSFAWSADRMPRPNELTRAVMSPGDVLLFRGDLIHGGGANTTVGERRRGASMSYCAGWLRTVDNGVLTMPPERVRDLDPVNQELLGYRTYDGLSEGGGMLGLAAYDDPRIVFEPGASDG